MKRETKDDAGAQVYEAKMAGSLNADSLSAVSSSIGRARKCLCAVINLVDELAGPQTNDDAEGRPDHSEGRIPALANEANELDELVSQVHRDMDRLRSLM